MKNGVEARGWFYSVTLDGNVAYQCCVRLEAHRLLWQASPEDPDEDKILDCAQGLCNFREFGPPETSTALGISEENLTELCEALGCAEAEWRRPLPKQIQEWFASVEAGDLEAMATALAQGADIDALDRQHRSALWFAASERGTEVTAWLLEHKADPNIRDRYGRTLLMNTALSSDVEKAELYIQHGADKTIPDSKGRTAYLIAVEQRADGALIKALCSYAKEEWEHALHIAAWGSQTVWLDGESWFVEAHQPDVNTVRDGRTPLQSCLEGYGRHPWAARWLVEHGADLTVVDAETRMTILHLATRENMSWLVTACVNAGIDVNARSADGHTPLSCALDRNERPALLRALLNAGADPSLEIAGENGPESILDKAVRNGLVWSAWMLSHPDIEWTGMVCHAVAVPSGREPTSGADATEAFWMEFPAEWCGEPGLFEHLKSCANTIAGKPCDKMRVLAWSDASKAPWSWPGRKLWAVFPDGTFQPIECHRDTRPRSMVSDPRAFQTDDIETLDRAWKWPGQAWDGRHENYSVTIRHGLITWEAFNYRQEMPFGQFCVGGPPHGAGADRSMPPEFLGELCAAIGDWRREWEAPSSVEARERRVEEWLESQPKPLEETDIPDMVPHQSGRWCYVRADIEDHFHTHSGAGGDGKWTCWLEFPAEWCAVRRPYREHWWRLALKRAYEAMNEKSAQDPGGGTYILQRAFFTILSLEEAKRQPWRDKGKVLYLVTDRPLTPKTAEGSDRLRLIRDMGDPASPPSPIPNSPSAPSKASLRR